jgi:hypothetical protein
MNHIPFVGGVSWYRGSQALQCSVEPMLIIVIAAGFGALLGWLGAHATLGWFTLLPWAFGGLVVGYAARARPALAGALYGFALSFVFMLGVYTGKASVLSRLPFFAALGAVGAVCGLSLSLMGRWVANRIAPRQRSTASQPNETQKR